MPLRGLTMKKIVHVTPAGNSIADEDVFAIRLFIFTETNGESNLPINSILKLVDIFEVLEEKKFKVVKKFDERLAS
jgi:hypothetical protein